MADRCVCPYCETDVTDRVIGKTTGGRLYAYKCPDCGKSFYGDLMPLGRAKLHRLFIGEDPK